MHSFPCASLPPVTSPVDQLRQIQRLSRAMALTCMALIVLLPCVLVAYWVNTSAPELAVQGNLSAGAIQLPLLPWQRMAGAAVTSVPLVLLLMGLWHAKQCFDQFARGQVFTVQATVCLRRFAGWVAAAALAAIVAGAATSVILTLQNPPGMRHLSVGIGSNHLFTLFFAAVVWLMAAVIGQGQALAEENERFV